MTGQTKTRPLQQTQPSSEPKKFSVAELLCEFDVFGHYYTKDTQNNNRFRRCLEIVSKGSGVIVGSPELLVVMMNPGSSKPMDEAHWQVNGLVPAWPDKTQYQIMRVMHRCGIKTTRVINLSDLCEPNSHRFIAAISTLPTEHSIFAEERDNELAAVSAGCGAVVSAWGVDPKLPSTRAVNWLKQFDAVQYRYPNKANYPLHPLPRNAKAQEQWVDNISNQMLQATLPQVPHP